ncbi:NAD(P)/FAD-dependent oxidoreductase [Candidatus Formimonas warabiya]|uniref:FAD-binding dehydrogenase n=1 Tax=Formimonas warabiya TaxID=1761012 RepID=A0A3G1KM78_FORW1|nr:NAD(P)/FAD-dependent oxidoreductase [Candidatus Formimonas warabiya]ATW23527.1 FAD-binding dehydrogenase [Candidatus Formimonas warabiya]
MYDVIVIGAGPTGSSAAKELASNGYRVLLVEKFKMPRNKSCSGILIKKSIDLVEQYFGEATPVYTQCTPTDHRGMIFTNDKGKEYRYEQEGLNIWRSSFDYWLAQKAVEAGAEFRDETVALSCIEHLKGIEVQLKGTMEYTEYAKFVIACDGVVGSIKRKLLNAPKNYITTYQTFNKGSIDLDDHYFYAYLQPQLSEYDAWFNVKDNYLILGVSVKDMRNIDYYYSQFLSYMEQHHNLKIEKQEQEEKWLIAHIMPGCPLEYGKGKVLFAGETAGFLNPMGEGISAGMESGYAAAKAIERYGLHNLNSDLEKIYSAYRSNTASLKSYMERQWNFVASMASTFEQFKL